MKLNRRQFLISSGVVAGGVSLGFYLSPKTPLPHTRPGSFQPNAWLQILPSGEKIFQLDRVEMGQGVIASLPVILAEELDLHPDELIIEMAGVHGDYANPLVGIQLTGGSTSLTGAWMPLREAGAAARYMLMQAAARRWQVNPDQCQTELGVVINSATGESLSYAELAQSAAELPVPDEVPLKQPKEFRWLGATLLRPDSVAKVCGTAEFGIDVDLPDSKVAVVARCPQFGGRLISYDDTAALQMAGVQRIFAIHSGVVVVADSYWHARRALHKVVIQWDKGALAGLDSATIRSELENIVENTEPHSVVDEGDVAADIAKQQQVMTVYYGSPYLHHSPMEPQNASGLFQQDGTLQIWAPSQSADISRAVAAHFSGVEQSNIQIHTTLLGGGFGRRTYVDFVGEVAAIARAMSGVAVKLVWSREDDMQHDFYRSVNYHKVTAALNKQGEISSWQHTLASNSILQGLGESMLGGLLPSWVPTAISRSLGRTLGDLAGDYDPGLAEGAKIPYDVPNKRIGTINYNPGIPTGAWRSVGHSYNAFVVESAIDELAHMAGADPLTFRLQHLSTEPRLRAVLELVAAQAAWGRPAEGRFQGLAVHESFNSYVAQVVEISSQAQQLKVEKVTCVIDCGFAVNPDIIMQQMESGVIYGLSAAIKPAVAIADGAVVQSNFHDLPVLRLHESPEIEVHIVPSQEAPTGVGELAVPPLAPALANAVFQATGKRLRELPFELGTEQS